MKLLATVFLILKLTIPLPQVEGRFDHFAADVKGGRIFVAALGHNTVEVLDVKAGQRLHSIPGLHKPTGVLYLPELNQLFVANGDDGTLKIFDGATYQLVGSIGSLDDADNIRYDEKTKLIYLGFGEGGLAIIDPAKQERVSEIKLKGHPESFQLEKNGARIFVNIPDARQIAVIDREKREVIATWHLEKFGGNFPMALDETNHRLFVGCRTPASFFAIDTTSGKAISNFQISGDTDDLFYDARRKRIYVSCGEGIVDVIEQRDADHYRLQERIQTRAGARTSFLSVELNEFYLAVPVREKQPAEIRVFLMQK